MSAATAQRLLSLARICRRDRDNFSACARKYPEQGNKYRFLAWRANESARHWLRHARKEAECEGPCPETVLFNENAERMREALQ
jgi:hypothetical protein